jgi:hypothetical protein
MYTNLNFNLIKMKKIFTFLIIVMAFTVNAQVVDTAGFIDLSANGGLNPATGNPWANGDTYRLVFASSTNTDGTDPTAAYYNSFVQTAALNNAALSGVTFYAIVSDGSTNAIDNTNANTGASDPDGAVYFVDGTLYQDDLGLFWGNHLLLDRDENANVISGGNTTINSNWGRYGYPVWTGSQIGGTVQNPVGGASVNIGLINIGDANVTNHWISRGTEITIGTMQYPNVNALVYGISEAIAVCEQIQWFADQDNDGYQDGATQLACDRPGPIWKRADELEGPEVDCDIFDPNLTIQDNPCDDGNEFTIDDFVNVEEGVCSCIGGAVIPTLSQWGIIALFIIMLIFGLVAVKKRKTVLS